MDDAKVVLEPGVEDPGVPDDVQDAARFAADERVRHDVLDDVETAGFDERAKVSERRQLVRVPARPVVDDAQKAGY